MTIWFNKKSNGVKRYCSKSISLSFYPQHWRMIKAWSNGAKKGCKEDTCFDFNIHFLGISFSYTNWDYNSTTAVNLLSKLKNYLFLFTYKDRLNRICNRCGAEQRKYSDYGLYNSWWEEYKEKGNNPKCKCHRYTIQK